MASDKAELTPQQAAAVLQTVQSTETSLTAQATGTTNMIWGLVAAAIFLAYAAAETVPGYAWFSIILWAPFVAVGMALTHSVWASHAVALSSDVTHKSSTSFAYAIGFAAVATGLIFGLPAIGIEWSTHTIMLLVNGLLAVTMGLVAKRFWRSCGGPETITAGVFMLLAAIALGTAALGESATGLLAGLAALAGWVGAGYVIYARG